MKHPARKAFWAAAVAGVLVASPALAIPGYSTAHLNLRTGPGTQYPIAGVMEYNVRSDITGCLADYSWCSITVAGLNGWASAEYLVVDQNGSILQVDEQGAATGIPVVEAAGVAEVVAPATVGVIVGARVHRAVGEHSGVECRGGRGQATEQLVGAGILVVAELEAAGGDAARARCIAEDGVELGVGVPLLRRAAVGR